MALCAGPIPTNPKRKGIAVHKAIVVFEVEGGSDKQLNGHRKDTMPIVDSIKEVGWHSRSCSSAQSGPSASSSTSLRTLTLTSLA